MKNYKDTLNLPKTHFPMRANLSKKEPEILKKWTKCDIYKLLRLYSKNNKKFFLHDGPPYANGEIHLGHVLNKTLKDIIIKSKNLSGFDAAFTPSWDCHGLPIEHKIEFFERKKDKKFFSSKEIRVLCRKYASSQVKNQKKDFIRLGIFGDWKNSYLTMDYKNEANIVRTLSKLIKKGFLYRDTHPVHWCVRCQSSLAEAEVEYLEKKSYSTFFLLPFVKNIAIEVAFNVKILKNKKVFIVVWTTTPWTLPSSQAISINPKLEYVLVKINDFFLVLSKTLLKSFLERFYCKKGEVVSSILGVNLDSILLFHPLMKKIKIPIILGDHVKDDMGSGAVHTAPDHGQEDYLVGKKNNIHPIFLVDKNGRYSKSISLKISGKHIFSSELLIINMLKKNKFLIDCSLVKHSYPHCWRHKTPTIFYSTPQWFINIDHNGLRKKLIELLKKVKFLPKWGQKHMIYMLTNRPNWCISRQRKWGVPMSLFVHKKTGIMHPKSVDFLKDISNRIEKDGIEVWWKLKKEEFLSDKECTEYEKLNDVLDVWFDSGSIQLSNIYANIENIFNRSADVYIEGLDQYRGWFMSSLILSMICEKKLPYKLVLSHGFIVDENGYKLSKSKDNFVHPRKIIEVFGADVLRLWVASTDYIKDSTFSKKILEQSVDYYRKIRNTARFFLSIINDFDPERDILSIKNMMVIDVWMISKVKKLQRKIIKLYEDFNFKKVVLQLMKFCSVYMGSFYLEIIKDRQYTSFIDSKMRRSCQTAIYLMLQAFSRWIAPILSFTADEIWSYMPGKKLDYGFIKDWYTDLFSFPKKSLISYEEWEKLYIVKGEVNKVIEDARSNKVIKNSLESSLILYTKGNIRKSLDILGKEAKFLFLTSRCIIKDYSEAGKDVFFSTVLNGLKIKVESFSGKKCARCWHYVSKFSKEKKYSDICSRCVLNILNLDKSRIFV